MYGLCTAWILCVSIMRLAADERRTTQRWLRQSCMLIRIFWCDPSCRWGQSSVLYTTVTPLAQPHGEIHPLCRVTFQKVCLRGNNQKHLFKVPEKEKTCRPKTYILLKCIRTPSSFAFPQFLLLTILIRDA